MRKELSDKTQDIFEKAKKTTRANEIVELAQWSQNQGIGLKKAIGAYYMFQKELQKANSERIGRVEFNEYIDSQALEKTKSYLTSPECPEKEIKYFF